MILLLPCSMLFPYTTLFRSIDRGLGLRIGDAAVVDREDERGIGPAEGRRVGLEQVDRLLGLGSWDGVVVAGLTAGRDGERSEEHTSELQSQSNLVCRLLLEK